jgi:prepilin-type processing-associated H-X9-DG protein
MPQVSCPHCGQAHNFGDAQWLEYQGLPLACTRCGRQFTVGGAPAPPRPPAMPPVSYEPVGGYPHPGDALKPNRAAVWALILGVLSFVLSFLAGIPAVVLGIIGMKRASADRATGGQGMAILGLVLGIVGSFLGCAFLSVMISILLPSLSRAREEAMRVNCAASMRQIGMGLIVYQNANKGRLPDSLDALAKGGFVSPGLPVCPVHAARSGGGAGAVQTSPPGYVYLGKGMYFHKVRASTVVLYEQPAHLGGINVLYVDGHVEYFPADKAPALLADLQNGVNPPTVSGRR